MTDIVFLDTETLGLDPDAPVWEFAAVRRPDAYPLRSVAVEHFTIQHDPASYLVEVLREENWVPRWRSTPSPERPSWWAATQDSTSSVSPSCSGATEKAIGARLAGRVAAPTTSTQRGAMNTQQERACE